jgi:hypothetical protein
MLLGFNPLLAPLRLNQGLENCWERLGANGQSLFILLITSP